MARCCADALEALVSVPYLTGETFSLAGIRLMPHFAWFPMTPEGEKILAGKSNLLDWFGRVSKRPSAKGVLQQ
jgi:glutathione S-transferase